MEIKEINKEDKVGFNFEEEVEKSKVIKEYTAKAKFTVDKGKFVFYQLKCITRVDGFNIPHTRDERLSERQHQFLIKYLSMNLNNKKDTYDAVFQVRELNETKRKFYCWIITFEDNYKLPLLVQNDERNFIESLYFKKAVK